MPRRRAIPTALLQFLKLAADQLQLLRILDVFLQPVELRARIVFQSGAAEVRGGGKPRVDCQGIRCTAVDQQRGFQQIFRRALKIVVGFGDPAAPEENLAPQRRRGERQQRAIQLIGGPRMPAILQFLH